jgi:hypothetical protein
VVFFDSLSLRSRSKILRRREVLSKGVKRELLGIKGYRRRVEKGGD